MRFGSLFAGAGGLDLGLEAAGMTCAFQVEIDPYATKVLEKTWPHIPRWRDICEVNPDELPAVDLLCGGFPCQPHSYAGKRKASEDDRDLWGEYVRIIRGTRPRWILAENVTGLLSSEDGRFFGRVLRDLAALGFDAEWDCIPASALGAPHQRDRVFVVAYADGGGCQAEPQRDVGPAGGQRAPLRRHPDGRALAWTTPRRRSPWRPESCPPGMDDGVADRSHRLRLTGNGVVPQVAAHVGRMILEASKI